MDGARDSLFVYWRNNVRHHLCVRPNTKTSGSSVEQAVQEGSGEE
jgi:hypothetical protein